MSLQRVFESARKMGVPVIVTDPAGRDPMVVITLEQFEAMAGETRPSAAPTPVAPRPMATPPTYSPNVSKNEETQGNQVTGLSPEAQESFGALVMESPEIPLEERFYLEPVDDGSDG